MCCGISFSFAEGNTSFFKLTCLFSLEEGANLLSKRGLSPSCGIPNVLSTCHVEIPICLLARRLEIPQINKTPRWSGPKSQVPKGCLHTFECKCPKASQPERPKVARMTPNCLFEALSPVRSDYFGLGAGRLFCSMNAQEMRGEMVNAQEMRGVLPVERWREGRLLWQMLSVYLDTPCSQTK